MKVKHFLPLALLTMMLTPAAFAASSSVTSNYSLTLDPFLNITKKDVKVTSGATFDDTYTTITLDDTLQTTYTVLTNVNGKTIYLKGTCPLETGTAYAIGGTGEAPKLAFTNISCTTKPVSSAVENALGTAAAASNANVIAFALSPTINPDTSTGATDPTIGEITNGAIPYTLKNGKYTMDYQMAKTAVTNTFSLHDETGTYQATLIMSDTTP